MKKVLIFGVFDDLHPGHHHFISQAKKLGDWLTVALAPDEIVQQLKGRRPAKNFEQRQSDLKTHPDINEIARGDEALGAYEVIKIHQPQIIALGYDQKELKKNLLKRLPELGIECELIELEPFEPGKYHSSLK